MTDEVSGYSIGRCCREFNTVWLLLSTAILIALASTGRGDETESESGATDKYRKLVAQLVSPNERPAADMDGVALPAGYDVAAQKRIAAARKELYENIEAALPFLVDAFDDQRYCMTIDWAEGDAYYNRSVGSICKNVIASHLEVYREEIRFSGPDHWNRYRYPISKEWWKDHQGHSLAELQVEAIDWAIEKRQAEVDARAERRDEITQLRRLRDDIAKSGKPAPPRRMYPMVIANH